VGEYVQADEVVAVIETDKVNVDIRSTDSGVIKKFFANEGDTVAVDANFYEIDTEAKGGAAKSTSEQPKKEAEPKKEEKAKATEQPKKEESKE
jgi:2-oxoglutarate dehydrogenase E2 component (dihydrolipoamide succinyltransferase)